MSRPQKQHEPLNVSFEDVPATIADENKPALHEVAARPFLKWVGGKTQLLSQFALFFPSRNYFKQYLEPFVGSGAVFFRLQPDRAHLADNNEELINCYKQIQRQVEAVAELLQRHKRLH